jgi:hypothetical protein
MTALSEPIDIYTDWMDRARDQNKRYNPQPQELDQADLEDDDDMDRIEYDQTTLSHVSRRRDSDSGMSSVSDEQLESD